MQHTVVGPVGVTVPFGAPPLCWHVAPTRLAFATKYPEPGGLGTQPGTAPDPRLLPVQPTPDRSASVPWQLPPLGVPQEQALHPRVSSAPP